MRQSRDDPTSSSAADGELDLEVARLNGVPDPQPRSQRPSRVWRTIAIATALLLVSCFALNGPALMASWASATWQRVSARLVPPTPTALPPPPLPASPWAAIGLPPDRAFVRDVIFRPATSTPLVAYICGLTAPTGGTGPVPLTLYVTRDGAHSWQPLTSPAGPAATCQFIVDANQPQHVLLLTTAGAAGPCSAPSAYVSGDWGASWHAIALPPPLNAACAPAFFLVNGRLYAWSQDGHYATEGPPGSPLLVSDDGGATWTNAFAALSAAELPSILAAHADGSLLVQVGIQGGSDPGPPVAPVLWCSDGASGRWEPLTATPELSPNVAVSADPDVAGCTWTSLYAFSYEVDPSTGLPSVTSLLVLRGDVWETVPSAPVKDASGRYPLSAAGRVLGVGPSGTLFMDEPDTSVVAEAVSPPHIIWGWNPTDRTWRRDTQEEPGNARIDGFSWDTSRSGSPAAVLWLFSVNWGVPAFTGVFRSTLDSSAAPSAATGSG